MGTILHRARPHAILFLEPVVALIAGAALGSGLLLPDDGLSRPAGAVLFGAGIAWGFLALLRYLRTGIVVIDRHLVIRRGGRGAVSVLALESLRRVEILRRRELREIDPVRWAARLFLDYGTVVLTTLDGRRLEVRDIARPRALLRCLEPDGSGMLPGAPAPEARRSRARSLLALGSFIALMVIGAIAADGAGATPYVALFLALGLSAELIFWAKLADGRE